MRAERNQGVDDYLDTYQSLCVDEETVFPNTTPLFLWNYIGFSMLL